MLVDLVEYTDSLSRTAKILRASIEGRSDAWLDQKHAEDVVSPRQAVAHLLICEAGEPWIERIKHVMDPAHEFQLGKFAGVSCKTLSESLPIDELLEEFEAARDESLAALIGLQLTESDLEKSFTDDEMGTQTVSHVLAAWVAHDLYHLGQIFKSFSAGYVDRIGPYQAFLNLPHFN